MLISADSCIRYPNAEVLNPSGIEVHTFEELYGYDSARSTIFVNHHVSFYHIFRFYQDKDNLHYVGNEPIKAEGDFLLIVNKDIMHRYPLYAGKGEMVLFSDNFFAVNSEKSKFITSCSMFKPDYFVIPLTDETFKRKIDTYMSFLRESWKEFSSDFSNVAASIIRNYLHNLLITIEREYRREQIPRVSVPKNKELTSFDYINQFRDLLNEYYLTEKQVAFYAEQIGISEQRLSGIIKTKFGFSAKDYINEKMLSEASILLENTTLNISEIAIHLGYDFTYFVKFFSRHFGTTPAKYRIQNQKR